MNTPSKWRFLETCPVAVEADWLQHAAGFVASFVTPIKRERWAYVLTRRPRRAHRDSHKLYSDLDRRTCRQVNSLPAAIRGDGLFYDFRDVPRVVPAAAVPDSGDAIFSLVPGELAVYFFHEDEIWLCQT